MNRPALPKLILTIANVLVIASVLLLGWDALGEYIAHPTRDLTGDVDWGYFNRGLDRIHSFSDTGRWWTGAWCGEVPFWRPLTSYVFWGMRLLWPEELLLPRQIISVFLHLCFVGTAGLFLYRLTRRPWLVLTTIWLFAGMRPLPIAGFFPMLMPVRDTLGDPKNFQDPLVGTPMLLSLLLLAEGRWLPALGGAMLCVAFKETGLTVWPLAVLILAWTYRGKILDKGGLSYIRESVARNRVPIAVWVAGLLVMGAIHYAAVGGGYAIGTNKLWLYRATLFYGGPVVVNLLSIVPTAAITAILTVGVLIGLRRMSIIVRFLGILGALTAGTVLDSHIIHTSWDVSMGRILSYQCVLGLILLLVFWLLVAWQARRDWQVAVFGYAACLAASAPTWMATQTLDHTRYIGTFFMELAVAAALCAAAAALAEWVEGRTTRRRRDAGTRRSRGGEGESGRKSLTSNIQHRMSNGPNRPVSLIRSIRTPDTRLR